MNDCYFCLFVRLSIKYKSTKMTTYLWLTLSRNHFNDYHFLCCYQFLYSRNVTYLFTSNFIVTNRQKTIWSQFLFRIDKLVQSNYWNTSEFNRKILLFNYWKTWKKSINKKRQSTGKHELIKIYGTINNLLFANKNNNIFFPVQISFLNRSGHTLGSKKKLCKIISRKKST